MALNKGDKEITLLTKIPSKLESKNITKNGIYKASDDNLDGYNEVIIETSGVDINDYFYTELQNNWTASIKKLPAFYYNGTSLGNAFEGCRVGALDLSNIDTSNVTNLYSTFHYCSNLKTLDLSMWNVSKVTNMGSTFASCSSINTINLTNWDTSNVTRMDNMFESCHMNPTILGIEQFNVENVNDFERMFNNWVGRSDTKYVLDNFHTTSGTKFSYMFGWSYGKLISLASVDFSKARYVDYIFGNVSGIVKLNNHHNLGQSFIATASENNSYYTLNISKFTNTPKENLVEIIDGLYDIKTAGVKAQSLILGSTNIAKLTSEEIAVATNKGWTVS